MFLIISGKLKQIKKIVTKQTALNIIIMLRGCFEGMDGNENYGYKDAENFRVYP